MKITFVSFCFAFLVFVNPLRAADDATKKEPDGSRCLEILQKVDSGKKLTPEEGDLLIFCEFKPPNHDWEGFNAKHDWEGFTPFDGTPWLYYEGQV